MAVNVVLFDPVLGEARLGEAYCRPEEVEADVPAENAAADRGLEDRLRGKELL